MRKKRPFKANEFVNESHDEAKLRKIYESSSAWEKKNTQNAEKAKRKRGREKKSLTEIKADDSFKLR